MSIDAKILEQRLVTKDSVLVVSSLTRVSNKLSLLRSSCDQAALDQFLREVLLCKLETEKSWRTDKEYCNHLHEFKSLQSDIVERTELAHKEIERLKEELSQQQRIRDHRIKCEEVARDVNKHKSRSTLKRKIVEIEENKRDSERALQAMTNDITTRRAQFDSLLTALLDLESQITQSQDIQEDVDDEDYSEQRNARNREETSTAPAPVGDEEDEDKVDEGTDMQTD